ncbi:MAG: response regulator [Deltaproteobacteria bacterium]|jgi:signal transduction histidine kinase/CheY-like chemotaxis protein|nr:response regulator [Deltaproteobacteria bacterium]
MQWKQVVKANYLQLIFVFAAFFLMVLTSYISLSFIVRQHIDDNVDEVMLSAEANIRIGLSETDITLINLSNTVRDMIEKGDTNDSIREYLISTTDWMRRKNDGTLSFYGAYGFIRGKFIDGIGLNPNQNYIPQRRPWYDASVRGANDAISYTSPYIDERTGQQIISAVKNIYGSSGKHYGCIVLDLDISWFNNYVSSFRQSGIYGIILNQHMLIIGHPKIAYLGLRLYDISVDYRSLYDMLMKNQNISTMRIKDDNGAQVIVSFRKMFNGWHIGVITPLYSYYRDVYYTGAILSGLGTILMLALCYILLRISSAMMQSDEENRSKNSFIAMISHEIRTPLNVIIGLSEIQLQKNIPEDMRSDIIKIYNSGSLLLNIINDILDISKIEAGRLELIPEDYSLPELINDVIHLNIVRIGSKDILLKLIINEECPRGLYGDVLKIKQILNNLLSNAIKYTERGQITFHVASTLHDGNAVLSFIVSDTGIGIKDEEKDKLFKEYSRLNMRENRTVEGTGLGLAITKRLIGLMGGNITAESEYGVGSSFRVEIPQRVTDESPVGSETANSLMNFSFMEARRDIGRKLIRVPIPFGKILVVDDIENNLDVAKGLMLPYGLHVDCISSGQEAVEKIRNIGDDSPVEERYDAVFMDHMMPGMDGVEATRMIRTAINTEYARTVPIIALTANAAAGNKTMFLAKGFSDFLSKPINLMRLDEILTAWVRNRRQEYAQFTSNLENTLPDRNENVFPAFKDLKNILPEGVDIEAGVRRYGEESMYLKILRSYATHTGEILERLRSAYECSLSDYAILAHGLKGSTYGICANTLGELAEKQEHAARSGDAATVRANHDTLFEMTEKLLTSLHSFLQVTDGTAAPLTNKERKIAPDHELLEKMRQAAKRGKTSWMEEILRELDLYEYESGGEVIVWLHQQMDSLEYQAIATRLEEISHKPLSHVPL